VKLLYLRKKIGIIYTSKEDGLEVNIEETKYMLVPHDQNAEQNWDIEIGNE
jgi:hypothetical protein